MWGGGRWGDGYRTRVDVDVNSGGRGGCQGPWGRGEGVGKGADTAFSLYSYKPRD